MLLIFQLHGPHPNGLRHRTTKITTAVTNGLFSPMEELQESPESLEDEVKAADSEEERKEGDENGGDRKLEPLLSRDSDEHKLGCYKDGLDKASSFSEL